MLVLALVAIAIGSVLANDEMGDGFLDNDLDNERFSPYDSQSVDGDGSSGEDGDVSMMKRNRAQDQVKKSETVLRFGKRANRGGSDAVLRFGRAGGQRVEPMRFGRSDGKSPTLLRFGRARPADSVLRFGRARPADTTLRFGRARSADTTLRFG